MEAQTQTNLIFLQNISLLAVTEGRVPIGSHRIPLLAVF